MKLAEHGLSIVDELARRRGPDGTIRPVTSVGMLQSLGHDPRAGKNLGRAVALLDAACLEEGLPWLGRLILFENASDDFAGLSWAPFKPYIVESAPRRRQWSDADFARIRSATLLLPPDPEKWWKDRLRDGESSLLRALLAVLHQTYDPGASTTGSELDIPEYSREQLDVGVRGKYAARYAKSTNIASFDEAETTMTAPAYLIVEMHITDMEQYKQYMAAAPAAVKAYGGEYLVRGGKHETIEGDWQPHRVALLRFPSYEQARAFYADSDYANRVKPKRLGATEYFNMILVEGVAAPV